MGSGTAGDDNTDPGPPDLKPQPLRRPNPGPETLTKPYTVWGLIPITAVLTLSGVESAASSGVRFRQQMS